MEKETYSKDTLAHTHTYYKITPKKTQHYPLVHLFVYHLVVFLQFSLLLFDFRRIMKAEMNAATKQ